MESVSRVERDHDSRLALRIAKPAGPQILDFTIAAWIELHEQIPNAIAW